MPSRIRKQSGKLTCPKCKNSNFFIQRVIELRDYHFSSRGGFNCKSAACDEWQDKVDWGETEFVETREIFGIICEKCGCLVLNHGDATKN
jgi:predicted nucleic-acid-binding Zn-ribbon protein